MARRRNARRHPAPELKRRRSQREPKRRFILFCEGKNTEPAYFDAVKRACVSALIDVEVVPAVGVPYTIAESAGERARSDGLARNSRRKMNSFEENDQVWAVFDRDQHPRFNDAVALCEQAGVHVARSNPCFELWLILHEQDYDRYETRRDMQKILGRIRPEYARDRGKVPDCNDPVTRVEQAEQRAEAQLARREHSGLPFGNPSTTVGRGDARTGYAVIRGQAFGWRHDHLLLHELVARDLATARLWEVAQAWFSGGGTPVLAEPFAHSLDDY